MSTPESAFTIRTGLRPGDLGAVVGLHGRVYADERGFDERFEAYVAGPLAAFALRRSPDERIWVAERGELLVGCIAVVEAEPGVGQLRWFLVAPGARGRGIGRRLLAEAVAFCRSRGFRSAILWTESVLETAAAMYRRSGFVKVEEVRSSLWGVEIVEEKYERVFAGREGVGLDPGAGDRVI